MDRIHHIKSTPVNRLQFVLERNNLPENRETGNGYPDPGKDPDRIRRKIGQPGKQGL